MIIDLPDSWRSRALVLAYAPVDRGLFNDEELAIADSFRLEKRRREWLLSRYAAKMLAVQRGICEHPSEFVTSRDDVHVSITHSAPYAGAAIDHRPIGIDVEIARELKEASAHLFLSDREIEEMRTVKIPHRLIHYWSAKEAVWKQLGGSVETLKRVPIELENTTADGLIFDRVETRRIQDLVVALTR